MQLPDHQTLLAIGVTLVMVGVLARGFASSSRRDLARRKEHWRDDRRSHDALLNEQLERPPSWFERNFGLIANTLLVAGVVITIVGFARS